MTIDLYEVIERIRLRPALYLGSTSISRLDSFLAGYRSASAELEVELASVPPFGYFHDWVAMKLGKYEGTAGWCNLLLESLKGDEEKAFEQFFRYFDEFKVRKASVILNGVPYLNSEWWCELNPDTGERTPLERPVLVQIVKYTDDKGVFIRYLGSDGHPVYREDYCQDLDVAYWRTKSLVEKEAWQVPDELCS